ncbi:hypothetical protein Tco_1164467 [Tanacetum coccineum]
MDLSAFIRTADPRKVRIVERARTENERPIVMVAKHRTVTLLPTSLVRSSRELSASVEREFAGDASVGDGVKSADPEVDSLVRSAAPIMTEATTVATTVAYLLMRSGSGFDAGKQAFMRKRAVGVARRNSIVRNLSLSSNVWIALREYKFWRRGNRDTLAGGEKYLLECVFFFLEVPEPMVLLLRCRRGDFFHGALRESEDVEERLKQL